MILKYIVDESNIMVKDFLKKKGLSRKKLKQIRTLDNIYINNSKAKNYYLLQENDVLELEFNEEINPNFLVNNQQLQVYYEDEYLLIIEKEANISSMPSRKHPYDNVISIVTNYYQENNICSNIHLVNRLDYHTTGLMIIAKSGIVHNAMANIDISKKYLCKTEGEISEKVGTICLKIAREKAPSILRYVSDDGQNAITKYRVITTKEATSLVEVTLVTGRTHQIRVHFAHLHYPLIGDKLYGHDDGGPLMLHCYKLQFVHPFTNENIEIISYPKWIEGGEKCLI